MNEQFIGRLQNIITANSYVNLHSKEFLKDKIGRKLLDILFLKLKEGYHQTVFNINSKEFKLCEGEEDDVAAALKIINQTLEKYDLDEIPSAISVTEVLQQLSQILNHRSLVVFHLFSDIHDKKEKDLLRSIRKYIEIFEKSLNLNILIISERPTYNWELFPESELDDRHVTLIEFTL